MYSFTTRKFDPHVMDSRLILCLSMHDNVCIRCRDLIERYHFSIVVVQIVITTFVVSNFTLATFMDPGVIPKGELSHRLGQACDRM